MPPCAVSKGFFLNRPCGNPSSTVCSQCLRPICVAHCAPPVENGVCVDCHAKKTRLASPSTGGGGGGGTFADPGWFYAKRESYQQYHDYIPVTWGSYDQSYFDDQDRQNLEQRSETPMEPDDSEVEDGGLQDS